MSNDLVVRLVASTLFFVVLAVLVTRRKKVV
jgi:hypothetical protein